MRIVDAFRCLPWEESNSATRALASTRGPQESRASGYSRRATSAQIRETLCALLADTFIAPNLERYLVRLAYEQAVAIRIVDAEFAFRHVHRVAERADFDAARMQLRTVRRPRRTTYR